MEMKPAPPSPEKLAKGEAIKQCLEIIAAAYKVPLEHILSEIPRRGANLRDARILFVYHLYSQGLSFNGIGRILKRSADTVRRLEGYGAMRMMVEDRALLDSLPRIPSTLIISDPAPVTQSPES